MGRNKTKRTLARLKVALHEAGVTQQAVADAAGTTKPHVCNVLAGRAASANVINTAKRLLAEKNESAVA